MSDRIFVSIAVSKPENLSPLPGALSAARRMAQWAEASGYRVVPIDDGDGEAVTCARVRDDVVAAIDAVNVTSRVQRLVIFFAGHGAIKGLNETYWLLSNWYTRPDEAINLVALRRMLRFYGPKQVSIIGDSCQDTHRDYLDVNGSSILYRRNEEPAYFELDQFFAADVGERAFMIPSDNDNEPFCVFTEVLLDALEGDADDAYESEGGDRLVTSGSLAQYLLRELPRAAGRYNLTMNPQPLPGFSSDRTYARFPKLPSVTPRVPAAPSPSGTDMLERLRAEAARRDAERQSRSDRKERVRSHLLSLDRYEHLETHAAIDTIDRIADAAEPFGGEAMRRSERLWDIQFSEPGAFVDVLVRFRGRYVYACAVERFIATLYLTDDGDFGVMQRPPSMREQALEVTANVLGQLNAGLIGHDMIVDIATQLRRQKHDDMTLGCLAAYLYASIGDVDSVRSIAAFYARFGQPIPMDVALLAEGVIAQEERGRLIVHIPAVPERVARTVDEADNPFTIQAMEAVVAGPIAGRAPWFRSGWDLLDSAVVDASAAGWREAALAAAVHLKPGNFVTVDELGREALAALLQVEKVAVENEAYA